MIPHDSDFILEPRANSIKVTGGANERVKTVTIDDLKKHRWCGMGVEDGHWRFDWVQ